MTKNSNNVQVQFRPTSGSGGNYNIYGATATNSSGDGIHFQNNDNGSILMSLKSGGNLGIGTTSPSYKLSVPHRNDSGVVDNDNRVEMMGALIWRQPSGWKATAMGSKDYVENGTFTGTGNDSTDRYNIMFSDTGGHAGTLWLNSDNKIVFEQGNGNEVMRITGEKLGIGTTSPSKKLDVSGAVKATEFCIGTDCITNWPSGGSGGSGSYTSAGQSNFILDAKNSSNTRIFGVYQTSGKDGQLYLYNSSGGTEKVLLNTNGDSYLNGGNLGIGTTSPSQTLTIRSSAAYDGMKLETSSGYPRMNLASAGSGGSGNAYFNLWGSGSTSTSGADSKVQIHTGHHSWFNGGNVGIGTTDPKVLFQVGKPTTGSSTFGHNAIIYNSSPDEGFAVTHGNETQYVSIGWQGIHKMGSADDVFHINQTTNSDLIMSTNDTERMRIDKDGNVGIGMTKPNARLTVSKTAESTINGMDSYHMQIGGGENGGEHIV